MNHILSLDSITTLSNIVKGKMWIKYFQTKISGVFNKVIIVLVSFSKWYEYEYGVNLPHSLFFFGFCM